MLQIYNFFGINSRKVMTFLESIPEKFTYPKPQDTANILSVNHIISITCT